MNENQIFELADLHLGGRYNRGKVAALVRAAYSEGISAGARMAQAADRQQRGGDVDWPAVESRIAEYVADYEMVGEDEQGRDGIYTPDENDRGLIADAIHGLLADDEFVALMRPALATQPAASAEPAEVTDAMALAFHHAITDGAIGQEDVDEIKTGLRAALRNVAVATPKPDGGDARDAERYRWCLKHGFPARTSWRGNQIWFYGASDGVVPDKYLTPTAAIDAAIAQQRPTGSDK